MSSDLPKLQNNNYDYTTTQNDDSTSNIIHYTFRSHTALKLAFPQDKIIFHQKEGLPIKLSVQNFMIVYANCKHGIIHSFRIPIRSNIKWKVINGFKDGAFKLGYATNVEYVIQEYGECVIYYPPREGIQSGKEREVNISVTIKNNNDNNEKKYLLTIMLLKESGFRNRMSYRARIDLKKEEEDYKQINNNTLNDYDGVELENTITAKLIAKGLNDNSITNIDESKFCNECRLQITFDTPKKDDNISMQQLQAYFLTSEYVKINTIIKNNNSDGNDDDELSAIYLSGNGYKNHKVIDDVYLQPTLIWESSSGTFPAGNISGESIIYLTPSEDELSKSPVTLTLYAAYNTSFDNNIVKDKILVDRKKKWLLRRPAIMGG